MNSKNSTEYIKLHSGEGGTNITAVEMEIRDVHGEMLGVTQDSAQGSC